VTGSVIGFDSLSFYSLLVDLWHKRLVDITILMVKCNICWNARQLYQSHQRRISLSRLHPWVLGYHLPGRHSLKNSAFYCPSYLYPHLDCDHMLSTVSGTRPHLYHNRTLWESLSFATLLCPQERQLKPL
jgi:hypothetical protein